MAEEESGSVSLSKAGSAMARPERYHLAQIVLHWLTVALVVVQYWTGPAVSRTHAPAVGRLVPDPADMALHLVHNRVGIVIGMLVVCRLLLAAMLPSPRWRDEPPGWSRRAARTSHWLLYGLLLAQAATGFIASYLWFPISAAHLVLFDAFLALLAIHVSAAFWHGLLRKDDAFWRISALRWFRPELRAWASRAKNRGTQ